MKFVNLSFYAKASLGVILYRQRHGPTEILERHLDRPRCVVPFRVHNERYELKLTSLISCARQASGLVFSLPSSSCHA